MCSKISLFAFLFVGLCACQQGCISPCDLQLTTCTYVDYPVYPLNLNVSQNEAQAYDIIVKIQGLSGIVGQECVDAVKKYTCAYLYPSCANSSEDGGAPTKLKPCAQMCEQVNSACGGFLSFLSDDEKKFVNCTQTDPSDGSPFFGNGNDCYVLDNLENQCNSSDGYHSTSGCQPYDPSLSPLTSSYCAPFISDEIFVTYLDPPTAQSNMDIIANGTLWEFTKLYPVLTIGCYKSLLSLLCQTGYPTCNRVWDENSGNWIELGQTPCNEYCEKVAEECSFFSDILGVSLLNCSLTDGSGNLLWPQGPTYTVQVTKNITVENTCSNSLFPPNASQVFVLPPVTSCPSLLAKKPNPTDNDEQCWIPCPDPTYTNEMWQNLTYTGLVGSSVSFSLMAFLLLSSILSAKKRGRRLHMCVYLSVMLQNISFFINTTHPEEHVWCDDPITYATSSNPACGAQAFIFQWFTLAIAAWWLIVAFHMYCTIVRRKALEEMQEYEKYYHIVGWIVPLILTIITAAIGSHGYGPPAAWCYIHDRGFQNSYTPGYTEKAGISVDYWVFYIPIGFALICAALLMARVFWYIYRTLQDIGGIREVTKKDIQVQGRFLSFVVLLFIIFILVCEWRFSLEASDVDNIKHQDFLYVYCQIKNDLGIEYNDWCLNPEVPYKINYSHTAFETFLASSFGIFVFLAFGTDKSIFCWWANLLKLKSRKELVDYISTETTQFSTGSSGEKKTDASNSSA